MKICRTSGMSSESTELYGEQGWSGNRVPPLRQRSAESYVELNGRIKTIQIQLTS